MAGDFLETDNSTLDVKNLELEKYRKLVRNFIDMVSEADVSKAVLSIKSKASGYDGMDGEMVRMLLPYILPPLTHIFNKSLSTGVFPAEWKSANVVPLQKVTSPSSCNDYRPISLLPLLSKALEKLAIWQIIDFAENQNVLDLFQSGFRRRHSTATAPVKVTDDIRLSLDADKKTKALAFGPKSATNSLDSANLPPIVLDGVSIPLVTNARNLGVYIDNKLSWEFHVNEGPQYFQGTWTYLQSRRLHSLGLLEIPRHKTEIYGNSFHISAARLWNSLPGDIRDSLSLGQFKTSLVRHLKEQPTL
ncbi:hypothetical protein M8J77_001316 [Diaphorina citri]|nr:hypothetical protein M8J77_001316 [Diaphorina citri]